MRAVGDYMLVRRGWGDVGFEISMGGGGLGWEGVD